MENTVARPKHAGGRKRKGSLQFRTKQWYAVLTVTVDGESLRKWVPLGTDNKAVARRKLARLVAEQSAPSSLEAVEQAALAPETYAELAVRVGNQRRLEGIIDVASEEGREAKWILPEIGMLAIAAIRPSHIVGIYENARIAGKSLAHLRNLRTVLQSRFAVAVEDEVIATSPVDAARMPRMATDTRERAVVTDVELAVYLGWLPTDERVQTGTRERQTMSALARMFGGLRTGDLHTLEWSGFDVADGAFTWGVAPRKKTSRPQRIAVPESLRPILRDWWERQGKPTSGLVFPALRGKNAGVGVKVGVSHANGLRKDLQSAFKHYREQHANLGKAALDEIVPAEGSPRWKELFEETDLTRPVDFHSWRRSFVQALADTGMNAQQAQKLAGHADLGAHERYLRNSSKTLVIPDAALPQIGVAWQPSTIAETPDSQPSVFSAPPTRVELVAFGLGNRCSVL